MRFREHCFLRSPEWKALLLQSPVLPFQTLHSRTWSLRSRLCGTLVDLPSLIMHCSTVNGNQIYPRGWDKLTDVLIQKASTMLTDVNKLLKVEAEPLFVSYTSSLQLIQGQINYPDVISGVLDCVANTALLTIDKILRFVHHSRLRSSSLAGRRRPQRLEIGQLLDDPATIEQWRRRATTAFKFVHGESRLAAKPLDLGLRQIQSIDLPMHILPSDAR
jgi:hypothetical protein